jgi:hypothetical protein
VPSFTADVAKLADEARVWSRLVDFAAAAGCAVLYLEGQAAGSDRRWPADTASAEAEGLIFAKFMLSPAGSLEFGFPSGEEMSPQSDILLQLVADAVEAALVRQAVAAGAPSVVLEVAPGSQRSDPRRWLATR